MLNFRQLSCYGDIALVGICTLDPSKQNDNNDDNDDDDNPITATTHAGKLWATEETLHAFLNLFRSVTQFEETEKFFNIKVRSMEI